MDVKEVKAEVKAARGRIRKAAGDVLGARVTLGAAAMLALAFAVTLAYSPDRLPPIGGFSLAAVGLPSLEFGKEREIAGDIIGAADREGGRDKLAELIREHPEAKPWLNWAGLAAALLLVAASAWTQMTNWRRGIRPL
ncbi:MAG: hypothetical protein AB7O04_11225 [Hyphomonadaceae bacterium]